MKLDLGPSEIIHMLELLFALVGYLDQCPKIAPSSCAIG